MEAVSGRFSPCAVALQLLPLIQPLILPLIPRRWKIENIDGLGVLFTSRLEDKRDVFIIKLDYNKKYDGFAMTHHGFIKRPEFDTMANGRFASTIEFAKQNNM